MLTPLYIWGYVDPQKGSWGGEEVLWVGHWTQGGVRTRWMGEAGVGARALEKLLMG
jgi:hypothetical protein